MNGHQDIMNQNHKELQLFKRKSLIYLKKLKFGNRNSLKPIMNIINVKKN